MNTTPISLLQRLRKPGAQQDWKRFTELYTPLLYHWARRLGLRAEDASDLVQDVFSVLVEKLPGFVYDPEKSFRAWLRTVLLNKWRDRCRRPTERPLQADHAAFADLTVPDNVEVLGEVEYREFLIKCALQIMKSEFTEATWKACWEYVVCDRPPTEVAAELGVSVGAVYCAKSRVVSRLRQELEGLLG